MFSRKVLHLYSSWTAGGAEKVMLDLAAGLERKQIKNVIAAPGDSYLYHSATNLGLTAYPLVIKGSFDPIGFWKLWRIVQKENIDILHAHQGKVFWPCIFIKWFKPRVKVVFHRHAQLAHAMYSRNHYRWADAIVAISEAVAKGLREREKVPAQKLTVIYNGTDFSRFNSAVSGAKIRQKYGLEQAFVIGTVAAMNKPKGKGQQYLIEAVKVLAGRFPDLHCLIVGKGPLLPGLEALVKKLGVTDRVHFTGHQENVEEFIAAMDVFCLLSWDTEGFGQVVVEAQAMGKPVVGTTVGGIPETLNDGVTGFLIPPENTRELVAVLEKLAGDRTACAKMGSEGMKFVHEHFSKEMMLDTIAQLYRQLYTDTTHS